MAIPLSPIPTETVRPGSGASIDRVLASREQFDPFIMVDHFRMWQPTFGPHPHAGFSAVTYLFDDSETGFRNRDSLGNDLTIAPGSLHWTMAGRGVQHDEVPIESGKVAHGLQLFVNLPASHKLVAPAMGHAKQADMPRLTLGDATGRLGFGEYQGIKGPAIPAPGDATLIEIEIPAHGRAHLVPRAGQQGILIFISGLPAGAPKALSYPAPRENASTVEAIQLEVETPTRLVWLFGTPWREPLVQHGPFGMSSQAQLRDAINRYHAGEMGQLQKLPG